MRFDLRGPHQCACEYHEGKPVAHSIPCCEPCTLCGVNVIAGKMPDHIAIVHPDMTDSDPVLFGDVSHVDTGFGDGQLIVA